MAPRPIVRAPPGASFAARSRARRAMATAVSTLEQQIPLLQREIAALAPLLENLERDLGRLAPQHVPNLAELQRLVNEANDELAARLGSLSSAQQVCNDLLRLALERGGHDNITIVIGRARR